MFLSVLAVILSILLGLFFVLMWLRFGFDWARLLAPRWRPRGLMLLMAEASYTVTDPPIRFVRRVIPPMQISGARLDFAWSIVLILCIVGFAILGAVTRLG